MKYLSPFACAILLTACAVTPEDKQAARVRQLEKEARENFLALKAQEHPGQIPRLNDEAPATPKPAGLFSFGRNPPPAATPASRKKSPVAPPLTASLAPAPRFVPTRKVDDTVYYWQVQSPSQRTSPRQQVAEAKYARQLAKRPEDLTPEERLYAHEHF